jgi:hypothetical protein
MAIVPWPQSTATPSDCFSLKNKNLTTDFPTVVEAVRGAAADTVLLDGEIVAIEKHKLQDGKKKTLINADDALKAVFGGKKQVTMFEMTKHVSGHVK